MPTNASTCARNGANTPLGVDHHDRFGVHSEGVRDPDLEQLFEGAESPGKAGKGVGAAVHLALAGAHVGGGDELVGIVVGDLQVDEHVRDDADRARTASAGSARNRTHARHAPAAADQRVATTRDLGADLRRELDVGPGDPLAGRAEHADRRH
jgi:hypothetical protein